MRKQSIPGPLFEEERPGIEACRSVCVLLFFVCLLRVLRLRGPVVWLYLGKLQYYMLSCFSATSALHQASALSSPVVHIFGEVRKVYVIVLQSSF